MPAGDPAGYLPHVQRARLKRIQRQGAKPFRGRKPPRPKMDPATGGVIAPPGKSKTMPGNLVPLPRRGAPTERMINRPRPRRPKRPYAGRAS